MATPNAAAAGATPMDLIWNDGVVPTWLAGMSLGFVLLFPILRALFPKSMKQEGAFLLAFELTCSVPVRDDSRDDSRARSNPRRLPSLPSSASHDRPVFRRETYPGSPRRGSRPRFSFEPSWRGTRTPPLAPPPPSKKPVRLPPHPSAPSPLPLLPHRAQLATCAYYGVTGWLYDVDDFTTPEARLYAVSPAAVKVLQTNFAFQVWDFAVSLLHSELNSPEMLAHHSLAALLCYWGLTMPYMHYYSIYFMGVAEVSSVPLVLVDVCKFYPEVARRFPALDLAAKAGFGVLFLLVRDVFWVYTAATVWKDGLGILRAGNFPEKYPGYITASVLVANVFFTVLQLLWTKKLLDGVAELFAGGGEKETARAAETKKKK